MGEDQGTMDELRAELEQLRRERDELARLVRQADERQRGLFDESVAAVYVFDNDKNFIDTNQSGVDLLGYPREELLTMSIPDVDVDTDAVRPAHQRVFGGGRLVMLEHDLRHKDGRVITVLNNSRALHDAEGNVVGVQSTLMDITERKESEDRFRLLVESAPEGIGIHCDDKIVFINPAGAALLGARDPHELLGKLATELVHPEDRQAMLDRARSALQDGRAAELTEERFLRLDGSVVVVEALGTPIRWKGRPAMQVLFRDITQRKALEARQEELTRQLHQTQRLETIGTLAAGIAHDFNNILTPIAGFAQLGLAQAGEDSQLRSDLEQIRSATQRARKLIERILLFGRQTRHELEVVDLRQVIAAALELLRPSLPTTIAIEQHVAPDCGAVLADESQLHQVLMNLCTNAFQAMEGEGGVLSLSVEGVSRGDDDHPGLTEGTYLELQVRDTGIGMDEGTRARAFEPFFTTKSVGEGSGMGLSVVHGIVAAHGGEVSIDSAPGRGTTVSVWLPVASQEVVPAVEHHQPTVETGESVLVVDDDPAVAEVVTRLLRDEGFRVTPFTSSAKALECLRRQADAFDVLLSDVTMPEMTGLQLCEHVRRLDAEIPVVLMSGHGDILDAARTKSLEVACVLAKPLDSPSLARALRQALDARRAAGGAGSS